MTATPRCETITKPQSVPEVMESTNVTSSEFMSLSRLVSGFTMSMQDIMKQQAKEQTQLMRSLLTEHRRACDSVSDSDDGPDSETESEVDVCDQIDQLLAAPKLTPTATTNTNTKVPEFLTEMEQDSSTDNVTGAAITDTTVVGLVNNALTKRMAEDKLKQKLSAYPRPVNIEALQSPRVNPEVWRKNKIPTKSQDVKFQQIQTRMAKGLTPLVQMASDMCELRQNDKTVDRETLDKFLKCTLDSVTMMGSAVQDLSQRRKELIRPDLNAQ
ncbi:uncharacterized protein LOC110459850 [Mizuhopecten yessoensis]|uniref:uncharacterized protein LOC110459850 n=1 Tax=Mizuhopecten yessoensis TaxID=6573 RepID=UPI000B45957E|nr:uncharacterized protein LOC110459850 [Mizuhopecten yessoensis]